MALYSSSNGLPEKYFCVDVECVATGHRHDARAVALIAIVDKNERVVLRKKVKPEGTVVSYLTPLTGVKQGDLDDGESLVDAVKGVKDIFGPDVVLVGQGIDSDIKWLKLKQGIDFQECVDLGKMFKTFNPRYGDYSYFSLRHEANTLLQHGMISDQHDPAIDAIASVRLFKKYYNNDRLLLRAKETLLKSRPSPSWAKRNGYQWEGVCMAIYMPEKCFCGAPTLHTT